MWHFDTSTDAVWYLLFVGFMVRIKLCGVSMYLLATHLSFDVAVHVDLSLSSKVLNNCAVDGNYVLNCFLSSIIILYTTLSKHTHPQISSLTPDTDDNPAVISVDPSLVSACLSFPPHLSPWPPTPPPHLPPCQQNKTIRRDSDWWG